MTFQNVGVSGYPQVQLEWAPTTKPTDTTQTYVDITTRLREWAWGYGRNDELGAFSPGSGYVVLDNRDRKLDPSYAAGSWYGNIKPRKAFRLKAKMGASQFTVFVGYARGFPQAWPSLGADALVRVDLIDQMAFLATFDLPIGFTRGVELSGARIDAILDAIGFPVPPARAIDGGTVYMDAITVDAVGSNALSHINECADVEFGQFFDRAGVPTFHDRQRRLGVNTVQFPIYAFHDIPQVGDGTYDTTFEPRWDDTYLWNDVLVSGPSQDDVVGAATDSASQDDYWPITKAISSKLAYEPDRTALAQYHALLYAQPALRSPSLTFSMVTQSTDTKRVALLFLSISDPFTVTRFSGTAATMQLTQYIEGVSHYCRPGGPWTITFATSPADTTVYWVLEDPVLGAIDSTNLISP